jgi:outer membrane protein TolC
MSALRRHGQAAWLFLTVVLGVACLVDPAAGGQDSVSGQSAPLPPFVLSLSLRAAVEAAGQNNPNVLLAKEKIEAAKGDVLTQLGAMLPNLSSTVRQTQQTVFLGTFGLSPVRSASFNIFDARVTGSQNLFSLSLLQRWRASRETLHGTEFDAESSRFDTMASAALAYLDGLKAMAALTMRQANSQLIEDVLRLTKTRQTGGAATGLDTVRLEGQLANERQQVVAARSDLDRAKNTLANHLGLPFEVQLSLTDQLKAEVPVVHDFQTDWDEAVANRPEVQAQSKRVRSAELTYASITGERLPSLVAQGDTGLIGNRVGNTLDTYNMALLFQIPIFDGATRRPHQQCSKPAAPGSAAHARRSQPSPHRSHRRAHRVGVCQRAGCHCPTRVASGD